MSMCAQEELGVNLCMKIAAAKYTADTFESDWWRGGGHVMLIE